MSRNGNGGSYQSRYFGRQASRCIQVSGCAVYLLHALVVFTFSLCSIVRQSPSSTHGRAECAFWPGQVWWALIVRTVLIGRGFQPPNFDTSRSIALCLNRLQNHWQTPASALPVWHWRHGALLTQTERVRD